MPYACQMMKFTSWVHGFGIILAATGLSMPPSRAGLAEAADWEAPWSTGGIQSDNQTPSSGVYWVEQHATALDGTDAVQGTLGGSDSMHSWIETRVTGPTTLHFSCRVEDDPATSFDCTLEVMVGAQSTVLYARQLGEPPASANTGWREAAVAVASGEHTVRWQLRSNRGRSRVRVFLDQVWTSADPRPRITATPEQALVMGTPFSMSVPVASTTVVTLSADGLPPGIKLVPGTLQVEGTPTASGTYHALVTAATAAGRHTAEIPFIVQAGTASLAEALDAPNLLFTQPDNATHWAGITGQGHDGIDAAQATVGAMQTFSPPLLLSTTVNGPGSLSFWYRCDERGVMADRTLLRLYLGPVSIHQPLAQFEETAWTQYSLNIPAGPQLVTWGAWRMTVLQEITPTLHTYLDQVAFTPTTIPPQPTFSAWTTAWNVAGQPVSTDSDADGLNLLMEYASGGSPYIPNPELFPTAAIVDGHFTLHFKKASSPTDLLYLPQGSRSLFANSWSSSLVEVIDEDNTVLRARSKKPVSAETAMFLRVMVLVTP